jgi:hypothetical protein
VSLRSAVASIPGARQGAAIARRVINALRRRMAVAADLMYRRRYGDAPELGPDDRPTPQTVRELRSLKRINRRSRRPIIDPDSPVVVTMTTHGDRIKVAHLAIESVARGELRPRRHILYLDDPEIVEHLPESIRRLQKRGLEVELVPRGYRVHCKYWFYVTSTDRHEHLLATNEDDIVFPSRWLRDLVEAQRAHPQEVVTFRAHRMKVDENGIAPYRDWVPCESTEPSFLNFGTAVSGQIYPPGFLDQVRDAGEGFLDVTPDNDDIWLSHLAVETGRRTAQVSDRPQHFAFIPGTQSSGLWLTNVVAGKNDEQNARTFTESDVARLRAEAAR